MSTTSIDDFGLEDAPVKGRYTAELKRGNVKQKGMISGKTKLARDLFMHGNGDGKPIRNIRILAEKSGCAQSTISMHLPAWQKESEARAIGEIAKNPKLVGLVTAENLAAYERHSLVMQSEVERLSTVLPKLEVGTDLHADTLKLYIQSLKSWADLSGITAHHDLAITAQKEMIKQAARLKAKGEADRTERQVGSIEFN